MSYNLKIKEPADGNKVNIDEPYEVNYWCKKWGVSKEQLVAAVKAVGTNKSAVAQHVGNAISSVRWNIAVSPDTDQAVRMFLAAQGGGRKGDLSRFIEQAVRTYLFEQAVEQAKDATSDIGEADLAGLIDEAVQWARHN